MNKVSMTCRFESFKSSILTTKQSEKVQGGNSEDQTTEVIPEITTTVVSSEDSVGPRRF